ncbi:hypothetical protein C0J45_2393 [Silurus meridionalis]|nr:hypothetical protein C0J45_2393 [Silurus meridionalis]
MAPPRKRSGMSPMGVLRRQYRQFQLSSLAAELAHFLEQLSGLTVPANPYLPPRIVQSTSMRDMGTQTSPDLSATRNRQPRAYDDNCSEGSCPPPFSPYPSHWSPTDYSPTSPVALPSHRAHVPSPEPWVKLLLHVSCSCSSPPALLSQ